jgi:hypothetical protein
VTLAARISQEAFDGLPEPIQAEYKTDGDGFILDVQGVEGFQLANVAEMQTALQRERRKATDAEKALKPFKLEDGNLLDPEQARTALGKMEEIDSWDPDDKLKEHKERFEAQTRERYDRQLAAQQKKHNDNLTEVSSERDVLSGQLDETLRKNTAIAEINAAGGSVKGLLPIVLSKTRVSIDPDSKKRGVEVVGDDGHARLSPTAGISGNMNVKELVGELKADKELAPLFRGSGASGAGTTPGEGTGGGSPKGQNPFLDASWNLTVQSQLLTKDSAEYKRLQQEAINKEPEGKAARLAAFPSAGAGVAS